MGYEKQNFEAGMLLTHEHLNHMEEGIANAGPVKTVNGCTPNEDGNVEIEIATSWNDQEDKPELFSGNYNDLTDKPFGIEKKKVYYTCDNTPLDQYVIDTNDLNSNGYYQTQSSWSLGFDFTSPMYFEINGELYSDNWKIAHPLSTIGDETFERVPFYITHDNYNEGEFALKLDATKADTEGRLIVSIYHLEDEVVQLDEQYIPETIARTADIPELPKTTDANKMLVTDSDGNATWKEELAYKSYDVIQTIYDNYVFTATSTEQRVTSPSIGKKYLVTINGVEYVSTCYDYLLVSRLEFGNYEIRDGRLFPLTVGETYTLSLMQIENYKIKPLSEDYVPFIASVRGKGNSSDVMGNFNTNDAKGNYSHAEGDQCIAEGIASHAENNGTNAKGNYSHAEGSYTQSTGQSSHAEGQSTIASGYCSHSEGNSTEAQGRGSHAEGNYTIAAGEYQHAQGKFNVEDAENKYAHIVGNGTDITTDNRSNAHTLDWNGLGWFAGGLKVGGTGQDDETAQEVATKKYVAEELEKTTAIPLAEKENQQLTTDLNGNMVWEDKTHYVAKNKVYGTYNGINLNQYEVTDSMLSYAYDWELGRGGLQTIYVEINGTTYSDRWAGKEWESTVGDSLLDDLPFYFIYSEDSGLMSEVQIDPSLKNENGNYVLTVYWYDGEIVTTLDEKYIPDTIARTNRVPQLIASTKDAFVVRQDNADFADGHVSLNGNLEVGKNYTLVFDGKEYRNCFARESTYDGNNTTGFIVHSSSTDNTFDSLTVFNYISDPIMGAIQIRIVADGVTDGTTHTISLFKITSVETLSEDVIPDTIQRVGDSVIINSSTSGSTKKFKLTVDDSGTISAVEVTE